MGLRPIGAVVALAAMLGASGTMAEPVVLAIKSASPSTDNFSGAPTLLVELDPSGQRAIAKITTRHVGEVLDLLIDGHVVSSPRIQTPILGSSLVISGDFTSSQVADLARRLSNGHARVEVNLAVE